MFLKKKIIHAVKGDAATSTSPEAWTSCTGSPKKRGGNGLWIDQSTGIFKDQCAEFWDHSNDFESPAISSLWRTNNKHDSKIRGPRARTQLRQSQQMIKRAQSRPLSAWDRFVRPWIKIVFFKKERNCCGNKKPWALSSLLLWASAQEQVWTHFV